MLMNHTQTHNNWLSCLVKLKVQNTIKDDCSVSLRVFDYDYWEVSIQSHALSPTAYHCITMQLISMKAFMHYASSCMAL